MRDRGATPPNLEADTHPEAAHRFGPGISATARNPSLLRAQLALGQTLARGFLNVFLVYAPNYPIIGDADYAVSKLYGMLPASTEGDPSTRTPADNQTVRNVYLIGPDKTVKLILVYPMTTGRNFDY